MAIKSMSIRIEEEMLEKLGFVADYEGRSVNATFLFWRVNAYRHLKQRTEKLLAASSRMVM